MASLVDEQMTALVRAAVKDLASSGVAALAKYDAAVASLLTRLIAPGAMLDPAANLKEIHARVDYWHAGKAWKNQSDIKKMLQDEVQDRATTKYSGLALAATSDLVRSGTELGLTTLKDNPFDPAIAKRLLFTPSLTLFVWSAREALALYYYALGRKSAQITDADIQLNQTLDTVYLGYGLGCQQLRTSERLVGRLDAGLRHALTSLWP